MQGISDIAHVQFKWRGAAEHPGHAVASAMRAVGDADGVPGVEVPAVDLPDGESLSMLTVPHPTRWMEFTDA